MHIIVRVHANPEVRVLQFREMNSSRVNVYDSLGVNGSGVNGSGVSVDAPAMTQGYVVRE